MPLWTPTSNQHLGDRTETICQQPRQPQPHADKEEHFHKSLAEALGSHFKMDSLIDLSDASKALDLARIRYQLM